MDWTITLRFIEEGVEDVPLEHVLPIGSIVRLDEEDSDWFIIRIVTILTDEETILFASRKEK